jgi:hypothetical protein
MGNYYTYAYLREDKTPYYIGKGKGRRIKKRCKGDVCPPSDSSRVVFLKINLTEEEAFRHEIYMIAVFGRKDLGTGILRNKTNGGDGTSGAKLSEETKSKMRKPKSITHRENISSARKNLYSEGYVHNWTGKTHKPETIEKCRVTKLGGNNPAHGKHWWVDPTKTSEVMDYNPPDPSWTRGRKKR